MAVLEDDISSRVSGGLLAETLSPPGITVWPAQSWRHWSGCAAGSAADATRSNTTGSWIADEQAELFPWNEWQRAKQRRGCFFLVSVSKISSTSAAAEIHREQERKGSLICAAWSPSFCLEQGKWAARPDSPVSAELASEALSDRQPARSRWQDKHSTEYQGTFCRVS